MILASPQIRLLSHQVYFCNLRHQESSVLNLRVLPVDHTYSLLVVGHLHSHTLVLLGMHNTCLGSIPQKLSSPQNISPKTPRKSACSKQIGWTPEFSWEYNVLYILCLTYSMNCDLTCWAHVYSPGGCRSSHAHFGSSVAVLGQAQHVPWQYPPSSIHCWEHFPKLAYTHSIL